jgi:hypothetical protein
VRHRASADGGCGNGDARHHGSKLRRKLGAAVHLYYSANAHHSLAACVKGAGYISFIGGKKFAGICGGAWSGSFYYGVPGTSISGTSYFSRSYLPVRWRQTDEIYGVRLNRYDYVQGETSCPNHG